jgi:hypothetical protein
MITTPVKRKADALPPLAPRKGGCRMARCDVARAMHCFIAMRHASQCESAEPCALLSPYLRGPEDLGEAGRSHPDYVFLSRCDGWRHLRGCGGCDLRICRLIKQTVREAMQHARDCGPYCRLRSECAAHLGGRALAARPGAACCPLCVGPAPRQIA